MLWVNLIMDSLGSLALVTDPHMMNYYKENQLIEQNQLLISDVERHYLTILK